MRMVWVAIALAACSKKGEPARSHDAAVMAPGIADAAVVPADAAFSNDVEPSSPPPAPTLGKGRGDCKPEYAPRPTRDPNPMCKVQGGTFMMGTNTVAPIDLPSRPAHAVRVKAFRIDRYEVTVAQVVFYLNTVGSNYCPGASRDRCFRLGGDPELIVEKDGKFVAGSGVGSGAERLPMSAANMAGAERYCAWVGKRLPTGAEWEYAARHDPKTGKDYMYPWGDRFETNRSNCQDADCADPFPREAPVGSFDGRDGRGDDSSPFGLHDMAGNASELTASCYVAYQPCDGPCRDPGPATQPCPREAREQSFAAPKDGIATYIRTESQVNVGGFRCALPEPVP